MLLHSGSDLTAISWIDMASQVCSIADVPNEVFAFIFAKLGRRDLKATRLVCRLWSTLAITNLFERIYISCKHKDLEVFGHVSSHDLFRKTVKTIVYDASTFLKDTFGQGDWNIDCYTKYLLRQWRDLTKSTDKFAALRLEAILASALLKPNR